MTTGGYRLGIDFGTSNTVAVVAGPDGRVRPLLFDGSPLLASAVFAGASMGLLVGADAVRSAVGAPACFEENPKRRVDDRTVWLGEREYPVVDLIAAVLGRVRVEAERVGGGPPEGVVLTHPAAWGRARTDVLLAAARGAGLGDVRLVAEPVAAAAYFATILGHRIAPENAIVVYDLGAGTFDVSVLRPAPAGFEVIASEGLPDVGGLDLDAAVVDHARTLTASAVDAWQRLDWPQTPPDQQARQTLWHAARALKEQLSRHPSGDLHLPLVDQAVRLTREEFEKAARAQLEKTAWLTLTVLRTAGVPPEQIGGVFLVGGSSRIPLAATLLHQRLRVAPTVIDQPELVVAEGALHSRPVAVPHSPSVAPAPHVVSPAMPVPPVTSAPSPAPPVMAVPVALQLPVPPPQPARGNRSPTALLAILFVVFVIAVAVLAALLLYAGPWSHTPAADTSSTPTTPTTPTGTEGPANAFPAAWSGTWTGAYVQSNTKSHQLVIAITGGTATAQVRYPDLGCLGTLTFFSASGQTVVAKESILTGHCTPTGTMTINQTTGDQLDVSYVPDVATYSAHAFLTRS